MNVSEGGGVPLAKANAPAHEKSSASQVRPDIVPAPMKTPADDLDAYASLAASLSDPREDRAQLLAAQGLDEARWEAIDEAWQARFAEAEGASPDEVPPLLAAFSAAFSAASRARSKQEISFARFLEALRAVQRGVDMASALERLGLGLDDFLRAQARWTAAMLEDEALAEQFRRALR